MSRRDLTVAGLERHGWIVHCVYMIILCFESVFDFVYFLCFFFPPTYIIPLNKSLKPITQLVTLKIVSLMLYSRAKECLVLDIAYDA
jgi:hypothetical protein